MSDSFAFLPPRECERPYTVSEINDGIATIIEAGNTLLWIEGEISNWRPSSSGHCYFRLKDASSQIPAVIWRSTARELQVKPADGMAVMAIASLRVYQRGGYYQLDVHRMQPLGQGALSIAFQRLKAKLEREGLFDVSFKKPLPDSIRRIGVITSKNGAAIRDIVRVVGSRAPQTEIVLFDVAVQGDQAAKQIATALRDCNDYGRIDCIIVGRGGGSIEDLWAFNEEIVARAIFASKIPVISAVGHEIDFTIADFVADLRAPTPSAAAETAVGDREEKQRVLSLVSERFIAAFIRRFHTAHRDYFRLLRHGAFRKPWRLFLELQQLLDDLRRRLQQATARSLRQRSMRLSAAAGQLHALNPLSVLARGYSVVSKEDGTVVRAAQQLAAGEAVRMRFAAGEARGRIEKVEKE
ncbi:MAG: exodeoxyribonuclease VII large subunit [Chitinispirillaceae bacterium]|nr:exodeoxyribonuclease VII large subunit [Chitinispirillaceae bacterium]